MYEKERNVNSENLCEILRVCEGVLTKVQTSVFTKR